MDNKTSERILPLSNLFQEKAKKKYKIVQQITKQQNLSTQRIAELLKGV